MQTVASLQIENLANSFFLGFDSFEIKSAPIRKDSLLNYDLVILLTDHDEYDYAMIEENAKMIIDTRGKFSNENKKVRKA